MEKVLAYIRYSSRNQDEGNSVAAQTTTIQNYADAHDMEIEEFYIDMAKTGRNTNRPKYQQMLEDIENGNVEAKCIIVRAVDRLHRNAKNQLADMEWFAANGIRFISVTDSIDTATETSKLLTTIKAAVAEDFSETLSKNTRAGLLECAKQCRHLGGKPPIGYKVNAEGFYEVDDITAPIVRDIYSLYLQGMGYDYIIRHLKEKGYKTSEGRDFSKASLNKILTNPKYMGTYTYDKSAPKTSEGKRNSAAVKANYISIDNGMPAIVSAEDYQAVQQKMLNHAHKQVNRMSKNYYALNGKIHCNECGKAFSGNVNHSGGNKYLYYKGSCDCGGKSIRTDRVNNFVFYALQQCIFCPDNKDAIMKKMNAKLAVRNTLHTAEMNTIQNRIHGIENAQNNLTGYLESGKATQTILDKLAKNEAELDMLHAQLNAKSQEIATVDDITYNRLVGKFVQYMGTQKSPEAFALRDAAIEMIRMDKNGAAIHFKPGVTADTATLQYFKDSEEV